MIDAASDRRPEPPEGTSSRPAPVRLRASVHRELVEAARKGYPHEVCGLLIGRDDASGTQVVRITHAANLRTDRLADRYTLDPDDYLVADRAAQREGLEIIGIWHTHPDHPARPSQTDLDAAWEGYSYLILSIERDRLADFTSWRLDGDRFVEQPIEETTR